MNIHYRKIEPKDLTEIAEKYAEYYNSADNGCWTFDKAYKRISQICSMQDSMCIIQTVDEKTSGIVLGYFKQFDDLLGYTLDEIVIFEGYQDKGLGTDLMKTLESAVKSEGCEYIELSSVSDEKHDHFYGKLGFYNAKNFILKAKFLN